MNFQQVNTGFKIRTVASAVLCGALLGTLAASAAAQDWKAEWEKTLAAAKKEGRVVMYGSPSATSRQFFMQRWRKDHPTITLVYNTPRVSDFFRRIRAERQAGKFLWDVAIHGTSAGVPIIKNGALDPIPPEMILPEVKDAKVWGGWDNAFFDKAKKYILPTQQFLKMPYYNAKRIPPEKAKRLGHRLLLDPAYKGKIVWMDPAIRGSGRTFSYVLHKLLGDEGLKKLIIGNEVYMPTNQKETVERVARGLAWIGLGPNYPADIQPYIKAGLDLDIRPLGNTPDAAAYGNVGGTALMVYNKRPHPNAARVFVNWVLSKEVQYAFAKAMKQDSRRNDVPSVVPSDRRFLPDQKYIEPQREEMFGPVRKSQAYIAKIRREAKKDN